MKSRKWIIIAVAVLGVFLFARFSTQKQAGKGEESIRKIRPVLGRIENFIMTTGVVEPQNRLQVIPPISGRVEEILVEEGDLVKKGDILVLMSSTERAALLDAAVSKGKEAVDYWAQVYKPTPLTAPINGEVIGRKAEAGQTVTASTSVLILSDRLIISAQVDESDIGGVKVGQKASVTLDAYPRHTIQGTVDHISYESSTVNNVIVYHVDIISKQVPDYFRSGMSANVQIIRSQKDNVLMIPREAYFAEGEEKFVLLSGHKGGANDQGTKRLIKVGDEDDVNVEIVSGLSEADEVIIRSRKDNARELKEVKNPFLPFSYKKRK